MFRNQPVGPQIRLGMGDDAAILDANGPLAVSTDSMVGDVHFKHSWIGGRELGAKAMAVNLSDLAAMAAVPVGVLLALNLPTSTHLETIRDFFRGVREASRNYGCPLIGGDLTRSEIMTITITVLGGPGPSGRFIRRSSARPGQQLFVTGRPGSAAAGLSAVRKRAPFPGLVRCFLKPRPRLQEALLLSRVCPDLAMVDLSDGLWVSCREITAASNYGIRINEASLPISPTLKKAGKILNENPKSWVEFGGEDYELLFTTEAPLDELRESFRNAGLKTPIHEIGCVLPKPGLSILLQTGSIQKKPDQFLKKSRELFRHF